MTQQNLVNSFGGESMAHMRYKYFATTAEKEGYTSVARLFRAIAHAEYVHAGDHYGELDHLEEGIVTNSMGAFGPGDTAKNLQLGIDGETFEITEMYPVYIQVAEFQDEDGAVRTFEWALTTEKEHLKLFKRAKEAVDEGEDVELDDVQVCEVCGYTLDGDAPDKCPTCGAKKEKFTAFEA